jgi:hypothetical protein
MSESWSDTSTVFGWDQALEYVRDTLAERLNIHKNLVLDILSKCRSKNGRMQLGLGNESKCIDLFSRIAGKIHPEIVDRAVNLGSWLQRIATEMENQHWPIWLRLQFLRDTGGIANNIDNQIRDRVKKAFNDVTETIKGPHGRHDPTHDFNDDKYWLSVWAEALCWLFQQFYTPTDDEAMMREIEIRVHKDVHIPEEPFGAMSSFHNGLKSVFQTIKECGSTLSNTPQLVVNKYLQLIKEKGTTAQLVAKAVRKKITTMVGNPHSEFRRLERKFTDQELDEISFTGEHCLDAETYTLITALMVNNTRRGETLFQIDDISELKRLMKEEIMEKPPTSILSKKSKVKEKPIHDPEEDDDVDQETVSEETNHNKNSKKNKQKSLVAKTIKEDRDLTQVTKALTVTSDIRDNLKSSWKVSGVTTRCSICNMLHLPGSNVQKGECWFYNPLEKKMKGTNMLQHPGTIYKSHRWYISNTFRDELTQYGFPKMGISNVDEIQNLLKDLAYGARRLGEKGERTPMVNNVTLDISEINDEAPPKPIRKNKTISRENSLSEDSLSVHSEDDRE